MHEYYNTNKGNIKRNQINIHKGKYPNLRRRIGNQQEIQYLCKQSQCEDYKSYCIYCMSKTQANIIIQHTRPKTSSVITLLSFLKAFHTTLHSMEHIQQVYVFLLSVIKRYIMAKLCLHFAQMPPGQQITVQNIIKVCNDLK